MKVDVTVVVICYNDAENLGYAVRSVLAQSLRNLEVLIVDDHSSDRTPELARALCAEDSRVRYHRRETNSGGCGAPRNDGMGLAAGEYVMFLDSDDLLERHACKNLLLEAERTGADLVAGALQRVFLDHRRPDFIWYGWLYRERRHVAGIAEFPELVHDTVVTNKLYRRAFLEAIGVRFPEDIHYEDLVFSAETLTAARGIAVVPETVYHWNVFPHEARKTITNQRDSMRNLQDRLAAVRLARTRYRGCGDGVSVEYDVKILRHHLRSYLVDTLRTSDAWASEVLAEVRPMIAELAPAAFDGMRAGIRVLYAAAYAGDVDAVRRAARASRAKTLSGRVHDVEGRLIWSPVDPDGTGTADPSTAATDERARLIADLTEHPGLERTPERVARVHTALDWRIDAGELLIRGESSDPFHAVASGQPQQRLRLRNASGSSSNTAKLKTALRPFGIEWQTRIPLPRRAGLSDREARDFTIETVFGDGTVRREPLRFEWDGDRTGDRGDALLLADGSRAGRLLGDRWRLSSPFGEPGRLEIVSGARGRALRAVARVIRAASAVPRAAVRRVRRAFRATGPFGLKAVYPLLRLLPLDRDLVLVESHMGTSAFDNPRAVSDELRTRRPDLQIRWSEAAGAKLAKQLPGAGIVRRGSYAYLRSLARARYLVDNQSLPGYYVKRPGQRYLQTWHGIPFKKMGHDQLSGAATAARARFDAHTAKWDGLCLASPYFERVFIPAFGFDRQGIRYGSPRLDELPGLAERQQELRAKLGLPGDRRVVLYAPTFRDGVKRGQKAKMLIDLERWDAAFGEQAVLLVRAHYLNRFSVPKRLSGRVVDVSAHGNINELYAVADVLVTDYSSVMFDFALLDRPEVIFAPDYQEYVEMGRGAYFDLRQTPPGAFTATQDELHVAVAEALLAPHGGARLAEFRRLYAGHEDGRAAVRAVDFLLEEAG